VEFIELPQPVAKSWYRKSTVTRPATLQPFRLPRAAKSPMNLVSLSLCPITTAHLSQGDAPHARTSRTSTSPDFLPQPFARLCGAPGGPGDPPGGPPGGPPAPPPEFYVAPVPPPPTIPVGTLPSTAAFQEMLELLRVSEKTISQKHDELTETCRKTKYARGQQQINSKSLFAISQI